jgi:hypothetical protein
MIAYLARGWVRGSVLTAYSKGRYSSNLTSRLDAVYGTISGPLGSQRNRGTGPECYLAVAKGISTQIHCWAGASFYERERAKKTESIERKLISLQSVLQEDGWTYADDLDDWGVLLDPSVEDHGFGNMQKSYGTISCSIYVNYDHKLQGSISCYDAHNFLGEPAY